MLLKISDFFTPAANSSIISRVITNARKSGARPGNINKLSQYFSLVLKLILTEDGSDVLFDGRFNGIVGKGVKAGTEGARTSAGTNQVLKHHVPSNYERYKLAYRHIRVHVR